MTIHLYQQSKNKAYRLSEKTLQKLGFTLQTTDVNKGLLSGRKQLSRAGQFIFCDVHLTGSGQFIRLALISNVFSGSTGTFTADAVTEELFLETFHGLLSIQPPDNPMKLSFEDYALAAGF